MSKIDPITLEGVRAALKRDGYAIGTVNPAEYHAWKGGALGAPCVSKSSLMDFVRNPYKYKYEQENGITHTSRALATGSLIDCLTLTPELAGKLYTTEEINRRTKDGKARAAELEAQGITAVTPEEMAAAQVAATNARAAIDAACPDGWQSQVGMWLMLDAIGCAKLQKPVIVTGLLDVCPLDPACGLLDLKSTSVNIADKGELNKNMAAYNYGVQAALYRDMFYAITGEERDFSFVFVSAEPPCQTRRVRVTPDLLAMYSNRYQAAVLDYDAALATGEFGSLDLPEMTYAPPVWEMRKGGEA